MSWLAVWEIEFVGTVLLNQNLTSDTFVDIFGNRKQALFVEALKYRVGGKPNWHSSLTRFCFTSLHSTNQNLV